LGIGNADIQHVQSQARHQIREDRIVLERMHVGVHRIQRRERLERIIAISGSWAGRDRCKNGPSGNPIGQERRRNRGACEQQK